MPPFDPGNTTGKNYILLKSGRTWEDRTAAEEKSKNVLNNDNKPPTYINKENNPWKKVVSKELETDQRKLNARQRQLDIGKETEGYKKYIKEVKRKDRTAHHPQTPDKNIARSTRSWQGMVRLWRRKLHYWDPPAVAKEHQLKFANILASPYMFDEDESGEEEEEGETEGCEIDINIKKEDCSLEEDNKNNLEKNSVHDDEPITEPMLFWTGI